MDQHSSDTASHGVADARIEPYDGPVGGWGSVKGISVSVAHFQAASALKELARQNKVDGFACVGCAWAKPANASLAEFCENGAKATFSELTSRRAEPAFFARHTLAELRQRDDHDLEIEGRLTRPMRYDAALDRYVETSWDDAYRDIGLELQRLRSTPDSVVFYASGRASLETSYLYQLFARMYGTNNLPDSSNMCHESTSVALKEAIGVPVGTVTLDDFKHTDCLLFFGQNVGSNSPRMLHDLQAASERGVPIVCFNPLRERGLERFTNPQNPVQMLSGQATRIASQYLQVRPGGDIAAIAGLAKSVFALDDAAQASGQPRVLDIAFIAEHTQGLDAFESHIRALEWVDIETTSGLTRESLEEAARTYAGAQAIIGVYGMGLTQHRHGVDNVRMLVNLLLMRGHIGREGAGICPVRGHSNVQGQRTVGISEKPELVPLDVLAAQFDFEPPRHKGFNTVEACEAVLDGRVKAFIGLGGNFVRAVPDHDRIEPAWQTLDLTVHIATKLNRTHLLPGRAAWLLPCLGRIEADRVDGKVQTVSIEDSTSRVHASRGVHAPASEHLRSEAAILAGMAQATLPPSPKIDWQAWSDDYVLIRRAIEATWPDVFGDYESRMHTPGGFHRKLAARHRQWQTTSGKAEFAVPEQLSAAGADDGGADVFTLITLRSNDQFNTTVYGYDDRLRGISGSRRVLLVNVNDMQAYGLSDGDLVDLHAAASDGLQRRVEGLRVTGYDLPRGSLGGYYPECNPLMALGDYALQSKVPAAKSVPVRLGRAGQALMPVQTAAGVGRG